jgi:hypothetical protein
MVTWTTIVENIKKNTYSQQTVSSINIHVQSEIPKIPLIQCVNVTEPKAIEKSPIIRGVPVFIDEPEEDDILPPPPTQKIVQNKKIVKHTVNLPIPTKVNIDPIVLGLEKEEPLYTGAPHNNRTMIEREYAAKYEAQLSEIYKTEGGRNRGWTKTGLEMWIKPRVASGGNIKQLDKAKAGFSWQLVIDDKAHSAFLDYLCVVKKIQLALWMSETKTVHIYPAADLNLDCHHPLYNVDHTGNLLIGPNNGQELYKITEKHGYTVLPCLSVLNALSNLKLDELDNVAKSLGMTSIDGKKQSRIAAIAAFKLRQRLIPILQDCH